MFCCCDAVLRCCGNFSTSRTEADSETFQHVTGGPHVALIPGPCGDSLSPPRLLLSLSRSQQPSRFTIAYVILWRAPSPGHAPEAEEIPSLAQSASESASLAGATRGPWCGPTGAERETLEKRNDSSYTAVSPQRRRCGRETKERSCSS